MRSIPLLLAALVALGACADKPASPLERLARDRKATPPTAPAPATDPTPAAAPEPEPVDDPAADGIDAARFPDPAIRAQIAALRDPNHERAVKDALFDQGRDAAVAALIEALTLPHANVRTQAAKILVASRVRSDAVEGALVTLVRDEKDPDVLGNVVSFIDSYRSNALAAALLVHLKAHPDKMVRAYSAAALGTYRYAKAKPALIQALKDPESWVRLMAVGALKKLKATDALPAIRPLLQDENPRVRERAEETVRSLGG